MRKSVIFTHCSMNFSAKYYGFLFALLVAFISSCSVGNKEIPAPGGNIFVDTTGGTLGAFTVIISGDTTLNKTIYSDTTLNLVRNDSLIVGGVDALTNTSVLVYFATASSEPGVYYIDPTAPAEPTAAFLARIKIGGAQKNYLMPHGKITILSKDITNKIIRGSFDVNNDNTHVADTLYMRANFSVQYKD